MQKSQKGLLQTILHDILHTCPVLIEKVCPSRWQIKNPYVDRGKRWTLSELKDSLRLLSDCQVDEDDRALPICFCLFIDGLDEYEASHSEGDHYDMTELLQSFARSSNIKICASSRPWPVFIDVFEEVVEAGHHIEMHELTQGDILKYVTDSLQPHLPMIQDRELQTTLVNRIAEKAEGVFLWVYLVVLELIKSIRTHEDVRYLRQRLEIIPPGLEDYFSYIFRKMNDKIHRRRAAQMFLACSKARNPIALAACQVFNESDPVSAALNIDHQTRDTQWAYQKEILERQIVASCGDLLEIRTSASPHLQRLSVPLFLTNTVEFLHRIVKEFLDNEHVAEMLVDRAGADYDPISTLGAGYLYLLKKWYPFQAVAGAVDPWVVDFLDYARMLDVADAKVAVPLLKGFYEVDFGSSGHLTGPAGQRARSKEDFIIFLRSQGFPQALRRFRPQGEPLFETDQATLDDAARSENMYLKGLSSAQNGGSAGDTHDDSTLGSIREVTDADKNGRTAGDASNDEAVAREMLARYNETVADKHSPPLPPPPPNPVRSWLSWLSWR